MVIEDNDVNRKVLVTLLEKDNHIVSGFSSAEDSLSNLETVRPDIILSDINLIGMSGLDFARTLRAGDPNNKTTNIPIIGLTGNVSPQDVNDMRAVGFNGFLPKPVDYEKVKDILRKIVPNQDDTSTSSGTKTDLEVPAEPTTQTQEIVLEAPTEPTTHTQETAPEAPVESTTQAQETAPEAPVEPTTQAQENAPEAPIEPTTQAQENAPEAPIEPTTQIQEITLEAPAEPTTHAQEITLEAPVASETKAQSETSDSATTAIEQPAATNVTIAPPHTKPIYNFQMLNDLYNSLGKETVQDLLKECIDHVTVAMNDILDSNHINNDQIVYSRMHELKGMCHNFGISSIGDLAKECEDAAKIGNMEAIPPLVAAIQAQQEHLQSDIDEWLAEKEQQA